MPIHKRKEVIKEWDTDLKTQTISELEQLCYLIKSGDAIIMNKDVGFGCSPEEGSTMQIELRIFYPRSFHPSILDKECLNKSLDYNPETNQWVIN